MAACSNFKMDAEHCQALSGVLLLHSSRLHFLGERDEMLTVKALTHSVFTTPGDHRGDGFAGTNQPSLVFVQVFGACRLQRHRVHSDMVKVDLMSISQRHVFQFICRHGLVPIRPVLG